ncbi:hypothetical protein K0B96_15855 [Horticoccus luteus]|uniref:Uncharacterized protein n=1 Tax=Horticoccus luteus TaxID=2862869 RepID=A0A8F9XG46_9BACT|nr:hypothetical protein [Horticoccus luteus]QYM78757.1 hypothetical protein K0B96_15855 [Horticoccus luteus]
MANSERTNSIRLTSWGWCGLGVVLLLPWGVVAWSLRSAPPTEPVKASQPAIVRSAVMESGFTRLPDGPWGHLRSSRIEIEPPEDYIPLPEIQPDPLRWTFPGYSAAAVRELWRSASLTAAQEQALSAATSPAADGSGCVVMPNRNVVAELTPAARSVIYTVLAKFPANATQFAPFRLRADVGKDWFRDSGLPPDIITLATSMLYPRNGNLLFSDDDVVLPRLKSSADRIRFLKTLSRKSTLLVQLVIDPQTDVNAIAHYWGQGRRSKDLKPLLQSLVRRPEGAVLDIVHLLPPLPRALLYSYPQLSQNPQDEAHDCHWTALNFFNEQPDERFTDIEYVKKVLTESYYPVASEPTFGDVIVFVQPDGVAVHSCVYLAAGIVFTKNGAAFSVPWLLGNLETVEGFYSIGPPLEIRCYRAKDR